jgi:hypothetical protein
VSGHAEGAWKELHFVWGSGMHGLTETALDEGLREGLTKRPLNNSRIINNTSCGGHDSAGLDVMTRYVRRSR